MRNIDIDLDRELLQLMAPVDAPVALRERLAQIPQMHPQRSPGLFSHGIFAWLRPAPRSPGFDGWRHRLVSLRAGLTLGMTTSVTAAMASLVLGVFLGAGPIQGTVNGAQTSATQTQSASAGEENDSVAMVYAAADMPSELP